MINTKKFKEIIVEIGNHRFFRIDKFPIRNKNTKKLKIFISYSTKDSQKFKIAIIAKKLESHPEIEKVYFWEEDMIGDMYEYMENNIRRSDYLVLFCSENSIKSEVVKKEWKAAIKLNKNIIPIFENPSNIPLFITTRGIQFKDRDLNNLIKSIIKIIMKIEN